MRRADNKRERARHQYRDQRQLREHKLGTLFLELNEAIFAAREEEAARAVLQFAASACRSLNQMTLNNVRPNWLGRTLHPSAGTLVLTNTPNRNTPRDQAQTATTYA